MKMPSLTTQIFVGLVAGILIGWQFPTQAVWLSAGADIFLHLIKTIIAPLIFSTLVVGIAGSGSAHTVGRLSVKSLIYFEVVTTFALGIGLLMVNLMKPGAGVNLAAVANRIVNTTICKTSPRAIASTTLVGKICVMSSAP